jgi:hypothetical protein
MTRGRSAVAVLLGSALLLTGCGKPADPPPPPAGVDLSTANAADGNGLWLRSGADVTAIVSEAVRAGGPVHISGELTETVQPDPEAEPEPGRSISIDFRGTAASYVATVVAGDVRIDAVVSAEGSRVRGNAAFAREYEGRDADAVVCSDGLDPVLADFAPLLDPSDLVTALLGTGGVGASPPVGDAETIEVVTGEEGSVVGVLTVQRYGAPLPASFVAADASGEGELAFAGWGEEVDVAAATADLACPEDG